ncbi:LCP family protein [uncultured Enterococcus sp.]|uniref:LCP family glycopolymer transferase n=1 Tax=uncultured Enterococcus sp. TaxID=167972 RepID=UPI002619FFE3|nr:LCP family protein [uncultured Enterococcus sp.]
MALWKKILATILGIILALAIIVGGVFAFAYRDFSNTVEKTYKPVQRQNTTKADLENKIENSQPFSILLLGVDTGALGRVEHGRSDSIMVATVNPVKKQTTIVSIARDTYMEIVGHNTQDKVNHAYAFGGAAMSMDTLEKYLDIPINHYVAINMGGIEQLVDAVGGVEVHNNLDFTNSNFHFPKGNVELNGEKALAYTRMRYEDPRGDYGRQERQRAVVAAIGKKVMSLEGVTKYKDLLAAVSDNMQTDLNQDQIQKLALDYRDAFTNVKTDQLQGTGFMKDGVSYQNVSPEELQRVQKELKTQLEGA